MFYKSLLAKKEQTRFAVIPEPRNRFASFASFANPIIQGDHCPGNQGKARENEKSL